MSESEWGKVLDAIAPRGDRRDHRHAELADERGDVDLDACRLRRVELVERDDHRPSHLEQLAGEKQVPLEVLGVDDDDDDVGRRNSGHSAEEPAGDDSIGGAS
mgnify:CR=1 FL=1